MLASGHLALYEDVGFDDQAHIAGNFQCAAVFNGDGGEGKVCCDAGQAELDGLTGGDIQ